MSQPDNLHVYPAPITNESRIFKETEAVQRAKLFSRTIICGTSAPGLPRSETLSNGRRIDRIGRDEVRRPMGVLRRVWRQLTWSWSVYRAYRTQGIGMVNAHSVAVLPVCYLLSRRLGAALVYDTHELETETVAARGAQGRIFKLIEKMLITQCDLVLTVNESIAQWYRQCYPGVSPVSVRNVPEIKQMDPIDVRGRLGVPRESLLFVHVGRITEARSVEDILRVFSEPSAGPHVVFIGDGPLRPLVENYARAHAGIHWIPPVPPDEVVGYVRGCDAALCLIEPSCLSYELSLPNKAFEYALAGVPFVYTPLPEVEHLVGKALGSWVIDDPRRDLDQMIKSLDWNKIDEGGQRLRECDWPTWSGEAELMVSAYRSVLAPEGPA